MPYRLWTRVRTVIAGEASSPDFDWQAYLDRYPDLVAAGISTERDARRHWLEFGRAEGRQLDAGTAGSERAMGCTSASSLFLRAWGSVVCWDDAGTVVELQPYDPGVDYARDVYLGPVFARIRGALAANRLPFPDVCSRCVCLQSGRSVERRSDNPPVIDLFQAEPSYRCTLDCPGCVRREARRQAPRPLDLQPEVLAKVLGDLAAAGTRVRGFSFQGHGEPTQCRHLDALAQVVKSCYPDGYLAVATNCQATISPRLTGCGIDEYVCSVDGVDQPTFEAYRVGGDFALARRFMADACRARERGARVRVVWRYVLFEHNDQPEHLEALERLAAELGVDSLVLVFTQNGPESRRLRHPADLPTFSARVPVEVRWHGPSVEDLDRRLAMAREAHARGDHDRGGELVASVRGLVERYWASAERRSADERRVVDELEALS